MSGFPDDLPPDYPDYLRHTEADSPDPTWEQITRGGDADIVSHLCRIVADTEDQAAARDLWQSWNDKGYRRTVGLLVDKIYNEGWLDAFGPINNVWDGGLFFRPRDTDRGTLAHVLDSKSGRGGVYTQCDLKNGLFAFINGWNHKEWERGWMENNTPTAALHVGICKNGLVEVHLEVYNSLYTNGAPRKEVTKIPLIGSFNHKLFPLHRRWDQSDYQRYARTSANYYHLMRAEGVPLSF
ncbi:MAG TPA: hypothetical protein VKA70_08020 [Blastocatellia bacterium]|nr:hypothetical protein [Blastocatellia bacterium]